MKKIILILVLFIATSAEAWPFKYLCKVGDSIMGPPESIEDIAIVYSDRYRMVWPKKLNCMHDYNRVVCTFILNRTAYNLELNINRADPSVNQLSGTITQTGILLDIKSNVSCKLRD